MPVMMEKLYDALRSGDVPDDKARAAAVEAADFDFRLARLESQLTLVQWMLGFNLAMTVAVVGRLFLVHP